MAWFLYIDSAHFSCAAWELRFLLLAGKMLSGFTSVGGGIAPLYMISPPNVPASGPTSIKNLFRE